MDSTASSIAVPIQRHRVINVDGFMTIAQVADALGRPDMISNLKTDDIFRPDGFPYAAYEDCGMFAVVHDPAVGGPSIRVTGEGQIWLARRYPPSKKTLKRWKSAG